MDTSRLRSERVSRIVVAGLKGSDVAITFILLISLARLMGAQEFGIFVIGLSASVWLALLLSRGLHLSCLRFIPSYRAIGDGEAQRQFIFHCVRTLGFGAAVCLPTASLLYLVPLDWQWLVWLPNALLLSVFTATFVTGNGLLRAYDSLFTAFGLAPAVKAATLVTLVWFSIEKPDLMTGRVALWVLTCFYVIAILIQALAVWYRLPKYTKTNSNIETANNSVWREISGRLMMIALFQTAFVNLDIVILGVFQSAEKVAWYAAANKLAAFVTFFFVTENARIAPQISFLSSSGAKDQLRILVHKSRNFAFGLAALTAFGLLFVGEQLLSLYGSDFKTAYWPMVIIAIGQLVSVSAGSIFNLLILSGHEKVALKINALSFFCFIAVLPPAAYFFGIFGVAISVSVAVSGPYLFASFIGEKALDIQTFYLNLTSIFHRNQASR